MPEKYCFLVRQDFVKLFLGAFLAIFLSNKRFEKKEFMIGFVDMRDFLRDILSLVERFESYLAVG